MKSFKSYLIPSIIASILMSAYAIVDGVFIGYKLNDLGLAAINLAWPITAFLQYLGTAIGISGGIYISRMEAIGKNEAAKNGKTITVLILCGIALVLGGFFFLTKRPILILFQAKGDALEAGVEYITYILYGSVFQMLGCGMIPLLKNSHKVKLGMAASIVATLSNLGLDYLFIFVWNQGLKGAAIASVLAQAFAFLVCLIAYIHEFSIPKWNGNSIKEILLGSIAPFVLGFSQPIIIIITNAFCMSLSDDSSVAAYTLLSYMLWVAAGIALGTGDAIQPLFSYLKERGDSRKMLEYFLKCSSISFLLCFLLSLGFYFLRNPLIYLYGLSENAEKIFLSGLVFYLIGFLFVAITKVICSYLYSINQKILANILVLVEPVVTPLCYWIFTSKLGLEGLWLSFFIVQIFILGLAIVLYFMSRRQQYERINCNRQTQGHDQSDCVSQAQEDITA